jgi:hypothetical protein
LQSAVGAEHRNGHPAETEPGVVSDLSLLEFQIEDVRKAIDRELADLATKSLTPIERKAIRENLKFNIDALRDLKQRRLTAQLPVPTHGTNRGTSP